MNASIASTMVVQPTRTTSRLPAWTRVLDALGATPIDEADKSRLFALGSGTLELREVARGDSQDGQTRLGLAVSDISGYHGSAGRLEEHAALTMLAGNVLRVIARDGLEIDVVTRSIARVERSGAVTVCPLWMTDNVDAGVALLQMAGLSERVTAEAGQWVDMTASAGGLLAVHRDEPLGTVLAFETADLDVLAERFRARGLHSDIVDESYGRSLRFTDPDGNGQLWVNETMTDMYGFRRSG